MHVCIYIYIYSRDLGRPARGFCMFLSLIYRCWLPCSPLHGAPMGSIYESRLETLQLRTRSNETKEKKENKKEEERQGQQKEKNDQDTTERFHLSFFFSFFSLLFCIRPSLHERNKERKREREEDGGMVQGALRRREESVGLICITIKPKSQGRADWY